MPGEASSDEEDSQEGHSSSSSGGSELRRPAASADPQLERLDEYATLFQGIPDTWSDDEQDVADALIAAGWGQPATDADAMEDDREYPTCAVTPRIVLEVLAFSHLLCIELVRVESIGWPLCRFDLLSPYYRVGSS